MQCPYSTVLCEHMDTAGMTKLKECIECKYYTPNAATRAKADAVTKLFRKPPAKPGLMFKIREFWGLVQFVNWHKWIGLHYFPGNPVTYPAFGLIYKWSLFLGWFEIRKFLSDTEMTKAYQLYINGKQTPDQ